MLVLLWAGVFLGSVQRGKLPAVRSGVGRQPLDVLALRIVGVGRFA
jgi:hypothetical protein